jgi:hypothetical protein
VSREILLDFFARNRALLETDAMKKKLKLHCKTAAGIRDLNRVMVR